MKPCARGRNSFRAHAPGSRSPARPSSSPSGTWTPATGAPTWPRAALGYTLLWVLVAANVAALVLQYLSAKVGIATGKDLAAIIGERSDPRVRRAYAGVGVVAMLSTETAEFLGVVTGLRLLLRIPLLPSIGIGAALVLGLLALGRRGDSRNLERAIFVLLGVVGVAYIVELWLVPPDVGSTLSGLLPGNVTSSTLPVIVGMVGAVVMPHNLFLHSGLIQSRRKPGGDRRALVRRSTIESVVALNLALLVNAAIMLMARPRSTDEWRSPASPRRTRRSSRSSAAPPPVSSRSRCWRPGCRRR